MEIRKQPWTHIQAQASPMPKVVLRTLLFGARMKASSSSTEDRKAHAYGHLVRRQDMEHRNTFVRALTCGEAFVAYQNRGMSSRPIQDRHVVPHDFGLHVFPFLLFFFSPVLLSYVDCGDRRRT